MGKRGESIRGGNGSRNPPIDKRIDKQQHWPSRVVVPHTLAPNSSSASLVPGNQPPFHGYIFMCNAKTKADCFGYRVFGLPAARMDILDNVRPGMKLFLFDFDLRLLYGIYEPASKGEMSIEPTAFGGRFSAQVRFQVYKDCLPLPESVFRPIIRDNYQGSKFRQELNYEHVQNLLSLFRPVDMSPSQTVSPELNEEPSGFGVHSRSGEGPPHHTQRIRQEKPLVHDSHASVAKLHGVSLPTQREQNKLQQFNSNEDHQAYLREEELIYRYGSVHSDDQARLINRDFVAQAHHNIPSQISSPSHGHGHMSTKPLSAAYWISVANESLQKEMHPPPFQGTPSASSGMAASSQTHPIEEREAAIIYQHRPIEEREAPIIYQHRPIEEREAPIIYKHPPIEEGKAPLIYQHPPTEEREAPIIFQHPPTENNDSSSTPATSVVVQPNTEAGHTHFATSSSLVPGYWTPATSQDLNQVYSDHTQWQQVASAGVNAENAQTYVVETGTNQYVPNTGTTFDYYNHGTVSGTNGVPVQTHVSTAYCSGANGVPSQIYDTSAYFPAQAGDLASYYSGTTSVHPQEHDSTTAYYYANTGIPTQTHEVAAYYSANTGIPGPAHGPVAYYFQENPYGYSNVPPSSSQAPPYWDPNQVGVTHFPQQIVPSGNNISSVGGEHPSGAAPTIVPVDGL